MIERISDISLWTQRLQSDSKYNCSQLAGFHNSSEAVFKLNQKLNLVIKEINKYGWNFNFQIYCNFQTSEMRKYFCFLFKHWPKRYCGKSTFKKYHQLKFPISCRFEWLNICFQKHQRVDSGLSNVPATWAWLIEILVWRVQGSFPTSAIILCFPCCYPNNLHVKKSWSCIEPCFSFCLILHSSQFCFYDTTVCSRDNKFSISTLRRDQGGKDDVVRRGWYQPSGN